MSQQDLTSDMLTRIRNAVRNHAPSVVCLNNKLNQGVAGVLQHEGYINAFEVIDDGRQGALRIELKYGQRGEKVINTIDRVSKPGRRVYSGNQDLPRPLQGLPNRLRDRKARDQAIDLLIEHDYVVEIKDGKATTLKVNPKAITA